MDLFLNFGLVALRCFFIDTGKPTTKVLITQSMTKCEKLAKFEKFFKCLCQRFTNLNVFKSCFFSPGSQLANAKHQPDLESNPSLQKKCDKLQHDLHRAQKSIERLKQREKELVTR